jgi:hypothetical protein
MQTLLLDWVYLLFLPKILLTYYASVQIEHISKLHKCGLRPDFSNASLHRAWFSIDFPTANIEYSPEYQTWWLHRSYRRNLHTALEFSEKQQ